VETSPGIVYVWLNLPPIPLLLVAEAPLIDLFSTKDATEGGVKMAAVKANYCLLLGSVASYLLLR
jgi:hypothetical protein